MAGPKQPQPTKGNPFAPLFRRNENLNPILNKGIKNNYKEFSFEVSEKPVPGTLLKIVPSIKGYHFLSDKIWEVIEYKEFKSLNKGIRFDKKVDKSNFIFLKNSDRAIEIAIVDRKYMYADSPVKLFKNIYPELIDNFQISMNVPIQRNEPVPTNSDELNYDDFLKPQNNFSITRRHSRRKSRRKSIRKSEPSLKDSHSHYS